MAGDPTAFERAWAEHVDDFDACIAAHYLARAQPDARSTLEWKERALFHARRVWALDRTAVVTYPPQAGTSDHAPRRVAPSSAPRRGAPL